MKKTLLVAIAAFAMLGAQAQSPVVNYSFEQTLASTGSGPSLTHNTNQPTYSDNAIGNNGVYSVFLNLEHLTANFATPSNLTGYTINYWVKLGTNAGYNVAVTNLRLIETTGSSSVFSGSFLTATNDRRRPYFEIYTSTSNASLFNTSDTLDDNWHMLTFKWKTDSAFIFIDGVEKLAVEAPANFVESNEMLTVGALRNKINGIDGAQSRFLGSIDELRIYETDLSNASILSLYNTGNIVSSIYNVTDDIKVGMYPNPANTVLNIKTSEHIVKAEVYNMMGSLVQEEGGTIEQINVADLARGVYVLRLTTEDGKQLGRKFTKE